MMMWGIALFASCWFMAWVLCRSAATVSREERSMKQEDHDG